MRDHVFGGGVLTNWLAIAGLISLAYWAWRVIAAMRHRSNDVPGTLPTVGAAVTALGAPHPGLAAPGPGAPLEDIAAIAAAVTAMLGAHRIIHLEAVGPGHWAFEGRWAQQTSHNLG